MMAVWVVENAKDFGFATTSGSCALQVAIAIVGVEYERQKGKDMEKAAKEKAFQEKDAADKRVCTYQLPCNLN